MIKTKKKKRKKDKIVVASAYTKRVLVKYGKLNVVTMEELAAGCL